MNTDKKITKTSINKTKNYWFSFLFLQVENEPNLAIQKLIFVPPEIRILNGLYGPAPMLPAYFSFSFWKKIQSKKSLRLKRKGTTWVPTFCLRVCVTRENKFGVTHKRCRFNWWGVGVSPKRCHRTIKVMRQKPTLWDDNAGRIDSMFIWVSV